MSNLMNYAWEFLYTNPTPRAIEELLRSDKPLTELERHTLQAALEGSLDWAGSSARSIDIDAQVWADKLRDT